MPASVLLMLEGTASVNHLILLQQIPGCIPRTLKGLPSAGLEESSLLFIFKTESGSSGQDLSTWTVTIQQGHPAASGEKAATS